MIDNTLNLYDQILDRVGDPVAASNVLLAHAMLGNQPQQTKDWYSTAELASILGKSDYTVRERWCNEGRIDSEKDDGGKWRIPGHEVERLRKGGKLGPKDLRGNNLPDWYCVGRRNYCIFRPCRIHTLFNGFVTSISTWRRNSMRGVVDAGRQLKQLLWDEVESLRWPRQQEFLIVPFVRA